MSAPHSGSAPQPGSAPGSGSAAGSGSAPGLGLAVLLAAAGAVCGAAARAGITAAFGHAHTVAGLTTIVLINLLGAFLLGWLTEATSGGNRRAKLAKLALGTGVLGGFTTYSTFAVDVATAPTVVAGLPGIDVLAYLLATVVFGPVLAMLGIALAGWRRGRSS